MLRTNSGGQRAPLQRCGWWRRRWRGRSGWAGILCAGVLGALAGAACGEDPGVAPDAGADAQLDGVVDAALDAGDRPGADADAGGGSCLDRVVTDVPVAVDPDGPDVQIHAAAAFDGQGVWVVYSRPDALGGFDVYGVRIGCDGAPLTAPRRLNTTDYNDVDPSVVVAGGTLWVAWQTDTGAGVDNMQLLVRSFDVEGVPRMPSDRMLRTTRNGLPVPGNTWMPALAPLPNGVAVAGARAVSDASGFQVFLQRLDDLGDPVGETLDASFAPQSGQTYPALASGLDGTLLLAYQQADPPDFDDQVRLARFAPGSDAPTPMPPEVAAGRLHADGPAVAIGPDGARYVALADRDTGEIVLAEAATNGAEETLGQPGRIAFSPALAAGPGGGAVAYYLNLSGIRNALWVQRFGHSTWGLRVGAAVQPTSAPVPPYPPAIAYVGGDVYFVAWSEGDNPAFRIHGMFLRPPAP